MIGMASDKTPITIKKYANRRLYNTGSSAYVTLEDLGKMVKEGDDFVVIDAKSGEDITRSVLAQIIFEQEAKDGQSLLPIPFLRQLIRFYGDSMQMLVPSFLDMSLSRFAGEQQNMREQLKMNFGANALPGAQMLEVMEEQTRKNLAVFSQAVAMFNPFIPGAGPGSAPGAPAAGSAPKPEAGGEAQAPAATDLDDLKKQIADMQRQIQGLAKGS